ncbi:MarR family winged helix-turn-helix transcriptional regulator [Pseudomaricurvus sp. HS19]|uniref:MarR family winged helix-turn-helix transcriptional regulator n=1 Tax=Pseudomaricurvus sp. HS19 TaxID=2692626 RepID=UPI00136BA438|nr:MarR family winged helix-turn-helix transcriptional regulator [Pseudomaricurvus sp. HS19]MYM64616.1 MarR family transcriptional regulator [Pseudomaricurvus sp. HS19]
MPSQPPPAGFPTLVANIHRFFSATLFRNLRADGISLTPSQWRVIAHLNHGNGPTQSELAERLLMEKAPLGTLLDKLEQNGLVERRADERDRRVRRVYMTPAAAPLLPIIEQQALQLRQQCVDGLTPGEVETLTNLLDRVQNNLLGIRQQLSAPASDSSD